MSKPFILILYYSRHGSVAKMAKYIARGIHKDSDIDIKVRQVPDIRSTNEAHIETLPDIGAPYCTLEEFAECQGLILGSPSYFGGIASPLKYFLDQTSLLWMTGRLCHKPASVFTSASTMHGGHEQCLLSLITPLLHHGMIIQGMSYQAKSLRSTVTGGTPYGTSHLASSTNDTDLSEDEIALCETQGQNMAKLVKQLNK